MLKIVVMIEELLKLQKNVLQIVHHNINSIIHIIKLVIQNVINNMDIIKMKLEQHIYVKQTVQNLNIHQRIFKKM